MSLVYDRKLLFWPHLLLVLKVVGSLTVPLSCSTCRVLEYVSLTCHSSTLRLKLIRMTSTMVEFFITLIHGYLNSMWPRHWYHTTWMSCFSESRYVFTFSVICRSERVIEDLDAILLCERMGHWVRLWSSGECFSNLLLLDPSDFFFRLKRLTILLMCIQINNKNHVPAKLTLTTAFRLFLRNLVMVKFLQNKFLNFFLRALGHHRQILLLRVNGLHQMFLSNWLLAQQKLSSVLHRLT